jgi:hypothetical protein
MWRLALCAPLFLLVAGCGKLMPSTAEKDPLTSPQRAAWEKARKNATDFPYLVVGYDADSKEWMTRCYVNPNLYQYAWRKTTLDLWFKEDLPSAKALAEKEADNSSIVTTAVIDLLGKDNPRAVVWYFKDGGVMKRSNRGPRPHLETELQEYLLYIQTNPEIVKPPKN